MKKNDTTNAVPTRDGKRTKLRSSIHAGEMGAVASAARSIWCERTDGSVAGSTFANDRY